MPALPAALARAALDALGDALVVIGADGGVIHLNPSGEELFDRSRDRAVGLPARALPGGAPVAQLAERTRNTGEPASAEIHSPRDSSVLLAAEAMPILEGSNVIGVTVTLRRPAAPDKVLNFEALAAGLAHEIKNPLAGLQGAAELLAREATGPQAEYAAVIAKEAKRVDGLVRELLDLARPAALAAASTNVHEVMDEVLLLARQLSGAEKVRFQKRYDPSLPPIFGDPKKLTQVILNLIRNAIEATSQTEKPAVILETGVASMRLRSTGGRTRPLARIAVLDNGPGISAEMQPRLFTPFATSKAQGTGLGLAVSRRIVHAHGGRIELKNRSAGGAEAAIYLPLEVR